MEDSLPDELSVIDLVGGNAEDLGFEIIDDFVEIADIMAVVGEAALRAADGKKEFPRLFYEREAYEKRLPSLERIFRVIERFLIDFADDGGKFFLKQEIRLSNLDPDLDSGTITEIRDFIAEISEEIGPQRSMRILDGDILVKIRFKIGIGYCIEFCTARNRVGFSEGEEEIYKINPRSVLDRNVDLKCGKYRGMNADDLRRQLRTNAGSIGATPKEIDEFDNAVREYLCKTSHPAKETPIPKEILETRLKWGPAGAALLNAMLREGGRNTKRAS